MQYQWAGNLVCQKYGCHFDSRHFTPTFPSPDDNREDPLSDFFSQ